MTQTIKPVKEAKKLPKSRIFFISALFLCICSGLALTWLIYSYWHYTYHNIRTSKQTARGEAMRAVEVINQRLAKLSDTAIAIANDLSNGTLKTQDIIPRLDQATQANPYFFGVGVAYQPYAYQPQRQLYSPYFYKKDGTFTFTEQLPYNYTQENQQTEWYHQPLRKGNAWVEPFYGKAVQQMLVLFGASFYAPNSTVPKQPQGVVFANYSLEDLKQLMNSLKLGQSGYGFILSKQGAIIVHPVREYAVNRKTIDDIADEFQLPELKNIPEKVKYGQGGSLEATAKNNGKSFWLFYEPIPSTGWTMVTIFFKDEVQTDTQLERRLTDAIVITAIFFFFFLSILLARAYTGEKKCLWSVVNCVNILTIAGIGYKWQIALTERPYLQSTERKLVLSSTAVTNQFLNTYTQRSIEANRGEPIAIPTGVMIQTMEFLNSNNITMSGYIWQKYTKGIHDDITRDIVFPESVSMTLEESYRRQQGNVEVVGWHFVATLRQNFDYDRYPFDYKDVWLKMWAADFDKNVILVPDFEAYDIINPDTLPGTEKDFVLAGWQFDSSFFQYYFNSYSTNFGINEYLIGQRDLPELYFTIVIRRSLLPLFINNFFPIFVVAIFLFCLMLLTKASKEEGSIAGFDGTNAIALGSNLMFVILLNQISLRNSITAMGIIYIEYFYFVLYFMILFVIFDAFLYMLEGHVSTVYFEGNLVPRLLYWPVFLGTLLIVTFAVF